MTTAAAIEPTLSLTPAQVASFRRDGFLRIEGVTTDDEVARIRGTLERLFSERVGRERGDQFDLAGADEDGKAEGLPQILGPSRFAPELVDTLLRANGLAIAKQLWGDGEPEDGRRWGTPAGSVRWGGDHTILKPARYGKPTPWHQDEAYWDPWMDARGLSMWLALQPATVANGCMWFVPGSHDWEILPHQSIGGDPRVHGLELLDTGVCATGLPVELPAGGLVIHHCRTLHYAGPNTTDVQRYAYITGYHAPGTKRTERRHVPWEDAKRTARSARAREAQQQKKPS
jgi:hypothetical protein